MEPKLLGPGIYPTIPENEYHADNCVMPSLSAGICKVLVDESAAHAYLAHPRLGKPKDEEEDDNPAMDFGTVGHRMLLGAGKDYIEAPFNDWKKNEAKDFREKAKSSGLVPVLTKNLERAKAMTVGVRAELARLGLIEMFDAGQSEVTAISLDANASPGQSGAYRRIRMDKLCWTHEGNFAWILDLKITEVRPKQYRRHFGDMYYPQRSVFYTETLSKVAPKAAGRIRYLFLMCEPHPPFTVVPVELDGGFRTIGTQQCLRAEAMWKDCITTGKWPGYTRGPIYLSPLNYQISQEDEAGEGFSAPPKF